MGARLVTLVLTRWTHVSDRAFRVLIRMAHTSLDEPNNGTPAGLYFGGRDLLADTLRNERDGDRSTAYRTVKRALAELVDEKAIERAEAGRAGHNAVYRMTLNNPRAIHKAPVDNRKTRPSQGDTSGPPEGDTSGPPEGDTSGSSRGTPADPPRNHEEPLEELWEERRDEARTAVTAPRACEADANPDSTPDAPTEPTRLLRVIEGNPDRPEPAGDRGIYPAPVPDPTPPALPVVGSRRWASRGMDTVAESTARRQAAIAAHRARDAAGE